MEEKVGEEKVGVGGGGCGWNLYSVKRGGLQFFTSKRVIKINCISLHRTF